MSTFAAARGYPGTLPAFVHAAAVFGGVLLYIVVTRVRRQHRHPSAAFAWVITLVTLPYLGIPLFLLFGTSKLARDNIHVLLLAAAFHARHRIVAVSPYFVPDEALLLAWRMACRRGVRVTLLLPARSNHWLAGCARERALRDLAAAGAEIRLFPRMIHTKAVIVDDALALRGSANLDGRSLFLNYELWLPSTAGHRSPGSPAG